MRNEENKKNNSKVIAIIVLVLLILAALITNIVIMSEKNDTPESAQPGSLVLDTTATEEQNTEFVDPLADRYVELTGYDDMVISDNQQIFLKNLPENDDFVIQYTIINNKTKEQIYQTDLIPSGQGVYWTPSENMEAGEYEIAIVQSPYWLNPQTNEYQPLTSGSNIINMTVR